MNTKSITATEAKNRFADLVDTARTQPVTITRNDRAVAVMVSPSEYSRLLASDDVYWGEQAKNAKKEAFLSSNESQDFLTTILNAKDTVA